MTRWVREFRLIPVLLVAAGSLLALKVFGLVLDGGYTLGQRLSDRDRLVVTTRPPQQQRVTRSAAASPDDAPKSWMQDVFSYPEVTGSVHGKPSEPPKAEQKPGKPAPAPPESQPGYGERAIPLDQPARPTSEAERALLERLQARRQDLEARSRELDMRETMVKDAEKKLDGAPSEQKPAKDAVAAKEPSDTARMKAVVSMYEAMKPKDAAKIFDRLDMRVLLELASQIKPQVMSAILAQMTAESAERLTVELAAGNSGRSVNPSTLPKIGGRPDNP